MAAVDKQQSWLPYESSRDCSEGYCSIYCPQWCYPFLPPPPPPSLDVYDDSPTAFSPLVIAIIGVVGSALLLVRYYTLVSKFCSSLSFCRRRRRRHPSNHEAAGNGGHQEGWYVSPANGLDDELVGKITVYRYRRGEGIVQGTDCSVCLAEFREGDSLRLLPKCSHAFHLQCIDTWLMSHSSCPLCRSNITSAATAQPELENMSSSAVVAVEHEQGVAVRTEDVERIEEEEVVGVMEIGEEDVEAMSPSHQGRMSMDEECMRGKDGGLGAGGGSLRSKGLHCVMSPVRMMRSASGGRSFVRQGRESTSRLPV